MPNNSDSKENKLLEKINLPKDLRNLTAEQLTGLAEELRQELIQNVAHSGGHFASSLGATELTVALHASFNTPEDRLIWDVGHQAYIHKMLTGRRSEMRTIRKQGGISGFLKREESDYDVFGAGHAGTSISAAVGIAVAFEKSGKENFVVPVIGDGSMTAGMAFEALNHAGELGLKNLIVVLNDNEMSIAPNVGAMSWFFSKSVTGKLSTRARAKFKRLHKDGYIPDLVYQAIDRAEEMTQGFISSAALLFEAFGFRYIGPVDGHSVADLLEAFENAKQQDVPVLVHVSTLKGKGFEPAEADPWSWHATKPFIPEKVQDLNDDLNSAKLQLQLAPTYTEVFADSLIRLANKDPKIVAITAAMPDGTGLDIFQKVHPDKFYDVGICEQHAVTFAAGLSCEGYKPVCAIYSTFLQRGYDQVVHDVCLQNLPVIFALDRAGVVGNDGETHQGIFDLAYLRALPNICIMAAKDENELQNMLATAVDYPGPIAVRYPRGNGFGVKCDDDFVKMEIGKAEVVFSAGNSLLFIAFGTTVYTALAVAEMLATEYGIKSTVVNARFLKPLDEELLSREMLKTNYVVTIEDHAVEAGFGSAVLEFAARAQLNQDRKFDLYGVQNTLVTHASQVEQQVLNGYDQHSILKNVLRNFGASVFEQAASPV